MAPRGARVTSADVAREAKDKQTGELVEEISKD